MPIKLDCPNCGVPYTLQDNLLGKKVRCQKCERVFTVSPPTAAPAPVDVIVVDEEAPEAPPSSRPRGVRERPDDSPLAPPRKPRRRPDSRPKDPPRKSGSALPWILAGAGVLVLLCGGGGVGVVLVVRNGIEAAEQEQAKVKAAKDREMFEKRMREQEWKGPQLNEQPIDDFPRPPGLGEGPIGPGPGPIGGGPGPRPPFPDRPKVPFAPIVLPPLPEPLEIKPAPVEKETPFKLPETVASIRVGGGGRFLVLHFPKIRKFGLFDVNECKIVRYVPASEDDVQFSAGMNKLVVFLPGSQLIQRYDLLTGEREANQKLELGGGKVEAFCMGHASAGPLLIGVANEGAKLYDIDKFAEIPLPFADGNHFGGEPQRQRLEGGLYWAGATGRVLGHTGNYGQPNGVAAVVFEGGKMQYYREHQGTWFVVPGPDDKHVYAGGHGVVSTRIKKVPNVPFSMGENSGYASHMYLPAAHGPYYFHAQTIDDSFRGDQKTPPMGSIRVYMHGDSTALMTFPKTVVARYDSAGLRGIGIENSMHLIPKAKLLVVMPDTRDELRLYPADLDAALEKSGRDFLIFSSSPPSTFRKGQEFSYKAEAKAKKAPVKFKLDSGPKGMAVDETGVVKWTVPADFADERVDVILSARDAGGQEAFQTFTLTTAGQ